MKLRDDRRWGPLDEQTVVDFEARNGIELPADYGDFLLTHHGGATDPNFYWVQGGDWGSGIESFYGFGIDGYRLLEYLDHRESIGLAADLLAIGDDGCCNLLAIAISGTRSGNVYFVDHEFAPGEPKHERFLASTFTEFIGKLCVGPD